MFYINRNNVSHWSTVSPLGHTHIELEIFTTDKEVKVFKRKLISLIRAYLENGVLEVNKPQPKNVKLSYH